MNVDNPYEETQFVPFATNIDLDTNYYGEEIRPADPSTFYQKRIFSDLSIPIKLSLKIQDFYDVSNPNIDNPPTERKLYCIGFKTTIGG